MGIDFLKGLSKAYDFHFKEILICDLKISAYRFQIIAVINIRNIASSHYRVRFEFELINKIEENHFSTWEEAVEFFENRIAEEFNG